MGNQFQINGASGQKQTRFTDIYTGRWSSGLYTNRSPLRDAVTQRWQEKFYGAAGDALIAGSNVEITNRLTLARRPGNSQYDNNGGAGYSTINRFDEFRLFNTNAEQIDVMIDQANAMYALVKGVGPAQLVWTKSAGAGQTYVQSVGNSLYFGNGVDNKKWLQSLQPGSDGYAWVPSMSWNGPTTPFLTTFLVVTTGGTQYIQQLTSAIIPIASTVTTGGTLMVTTSSATNLTTVLSIGLQVSFPATLAATNLASKTVTILTVTSNTFTAAFGTNYSIVTETSKYGTVVNGGTPVSGTTAPSWSTTVPANGNHYQGGLTTDNTVLWTNRGLPTENWGLVAPAGVPVISKGASRNAWAAFTYYSNPGVIIDTRSSNTNIWQVTTAGLAGPTIPFSLTPSVGNTQAETTPGTAVWKCVATTATAAWAAHTNYAVNSLIVGNASGTNCLFQLGALVTPQIIGSIAGQAWTTTSGRGAVDLYYPAGGGSGFTPPSLTWQGNAGQNTQFSIINGAGEVTGSTDSGRYENWEASAIATIKIPIAGTYSFSLAHDDGAFYAFGGTAQRITGNLNDPFYNHTQTVINGYTNIVGTNLSGATTDSSTWNFPTAGNYTLEINWTNWEHASQMQFTCNGQLIAPSPSESGATQPVWASWSTSSAAYDPTTNIVSYNNTSEAVNQYQWNNLGPVTDFAWVTAINYTLPAITGNPLTSAGIIIDPVGNYEFPYRTGQTGATTSEPNPFATGVSQLTNDNPNLIWINEGSAGSSPQGTISTFNGGWQYGIAFVNTLDNTVSNSSQLTPSTGNFVGSTGVVFAAGTGIPNSAKIDPQADYVAIFRTTDGESTPFLIPGTGNSFYTIPLSTYLTVGYTDTTPDTGLDNLVEAAIAGENTPPPGGAVNLTYHLNRIFFSVGNVVYWSTGPDAPVGNGTDGVSPLNFDVLPSLIKRIVPLSIGALVFTVSDVYLIQGQGTGNNPIQSAFPYLQGVGLLSYNALDINGSIIGFFTTDNQFVIFDPSGGVSYVGVNIGDQFRQNNGVAGTNWNPANVYVTWHVNGEDQGWYVSDGQFGWYRLMPTPSPETGITWSPFATIVFGCKAVQSIEVTPGVHQLLLGPLTNGPILKRDLTVFTDNNQSYNANAVLGSIVLAQPGQTAEIAFITTDCVVVGDPINIGIILNEALPFYKGIFEVLKEWESDPHGLAKSSSILGQRFYLSEMPDQAALCRHCQVQINFGLDTVQNELLTLTIYGSYMVEN